MNDTLAGMIVGTILAIPLTLGTISLRKRLEKHLGIHRGPMFATEILGEVELTKEVVLRHFWVRDILMLSGIDWRMVRYWSPDEGEKIQVVWQRKVWPEGSEYNG